MQEETGKLKKNIETVETLKAQISLKEKEVNNKCASELSSYRLEEMQKGSIKLEVIFQNYHDF